MKEQEMRIRLAAVLGFLGVGLGAAGAHGAVHDMVVELGNLKNWETAVDYHLVHAVVLLMVGSFGGPRPSKFVGWSWRFSFFGLLLFSGSLYVLSLTGMKWLGAVTPLGGLCLMIGWLLLALGAGKCRESS